MFIFKVEEDKLITLESIVKIVMCKTPLQTALSFTTVRAYSTKWVTVSKPGLQLTRSGPEWDEIYTQNIVN